MVYSAIPTELLYDIIERAWALPLTPDERLQCMLSFTLISKSWAAVFDDISSTDIHVPCKSFYYHLFNDITRNFALCKTITFTVASPPGHKFCEPFSLGYMTQFDMKKLTSLRTMNIVYYHKGFPDPYTEDFFLALPKFLPKLTVSYTFPPGMSQRMIKNLQTGFVRRSKMRYAKPRIGVLEVNGADEQIAAIWESLFPTRSRMIRDGKEEKQMMIPMSNQFDPIYGIPFLLKNWQREREFLDLHSSRLGAYSTYRSESPSRFSGDEGNWALPLSPDVTRSPTDSSVVSTSSNQKRRSKMPTREDPLQLRQIKVHGVQLVVTSAFPAEQCFAEFSWTAVPKLGDVGYFSKGTGMFTSLFNAFEPHVVQQFTIPSLRGYGEVQVNSLKWIERQSSDSAHIQGSHSLDVIPESEKLFEAKEGSVIRACRAILKAAGDKVVGGGKRIFKAKDPEFRFIESKGKNVAETWFEENHSKVLALYGRLQGISRVNLALVTGVVV
ncbi:hypothetical protein APHAL10511_005787 [Amanita phalloides]|nr:hypothetical protein APHAL10511_005787 [Amanita phalloides]